MTKNIGIIIIFLLLTGIGFILTNLPSNNQPILTLSSTESTTVYKIDFYKQYAVYSTKTNGFSGPIKREEQLQYSKKLNFNKLKKEIYNIPQREHRLLGKNKLENITIMIDNKKNIYKL